MAAAGLGSLCSSKLDAIALQSPTSNRMGARFQPTWDSLAEYVVPTWFRDAKFGMWAHWGPQCQPERGDWYARRMYIEGDDAYTYHYQKYGHPSKFGFKDVIHEWKAEKWDPETLVALYKKAGARYFMALANHHDNFDLFDSTYQPWNSTKVGPRKDIARGWANAAAKQGLPLGLSVHAAHAWSWYETAQRSDKQGPFAGVPYDGKLTPAEGKGKWWQGLDPQELYAQNHPLSLKSEDNKMIHRQWDWGNGVCPPSEAYCEKFFKRTIELIDKYEPELLYFDDTGLPFSQINDVGLQIAAHMYNSNIRRHGDLRAVIFGKILNEQQRRCMVWDIERGQSNQIEELPWQSDTCIGEWHYDRRIYDENRYKSPKTVIHRLADIVSKNGNLLLNIPVRGDGTIDEKEMAVVESITSWMKVNSEAIYGTRPWKKCGEGPALEAAAPLQAQGFNEGKGKGFDPEDIRFTTKGNTLYAIVLGWPESRQSLIKSVSAKDGKVTSVTMMGHHGQLSFQQTAAGLNVQLPAEPPCQEAFVLKIEGSVLIG